MTTHQRNFPSIDPAKARAAGRDGGQGGLAASAGTGPLLDRAGLGVASGAAHRRRGLQGGRGAGDADPLRRGDHARALPFSLLTQASTARRAGSMKASPRLSRRTPRGSPLSATIRCCSSQEDPAKVARANKANSIAYQPALEKITGFDINWNIVAYPTASWAKRVFPGDEDEVAVGKLAEAIFSASRVDNADPVAGLGRAQRGAQPTHGMAEREKISRSPLFRPGHGSHHRPRRRP